MAAAVFSEDAADLVHPLQARHTEYFERLEPYRSARQPAPDSTIARA